ncbi:MAG: hypothetical protein Ta2B_30860 [Termitinemataceae bacterium]|nr:MAG: hypothetical protein Ta2B_30860 [Termitinemataceae bacterium]
MIRTIMRRATVFAFILLLVSCAAFGQSYPNWSKRPIIGYNDIEWGTTISVFLRMYPEVEEVTDRTDSMLSIRRFVELRPHQEIESRQFVFFQNQLYEVYVIYGYVDEFTTQLMLQKLQSTYGEVFKTIERENKTRETYLRMVDRYIDFDLNLQIIYTVANVYNYYNYNLGTIMTCLYVNVNIIGKIEAERQNVRRDSLPF